MAMVWDSSRGAFVDSSWTDWQKDFHAPVPAPPTKEEIDNQRVKNAIRLAQEDEVARTLGTVDEALERELDFVQAQNESDGVEPISNETIKQVVEETNRSPETRQDIREITNTLVGSFETEDPPIITDDPPGGFTPGQDQYEYGGLLEQQYEDKGAGDQQFLNYLLYNPDLREHAEGLGLFGEQAADWARWHWDTFGQENSSRVNTPFAVTNPDLRNVEWTSTSVPAEYQTPTVTAALGRPVQNLDDIFEYSLRTMTPSELWEVRQEIAPEWNLGEFDSEGWRYQEDIPYGEGLLGDTLALSGSLGEEPVGQLIDTEDLRFIQDRYNDRFIANDFPDAWVNNNEWQGPDALQGYWDTLTTAYRDENDILRAAWDRPDEGWGNFVAPSGEVRIRGDVTGGLTGGTTGGGLTGGGYPWSQTFGQMWNPIGMLPYEVPHMQDWSTAEYQPGTIEGLGLISEGLQEPYTAEG
jgi:hypothetical protein